MSNITKKKSRSKKGAHTLDSIKMLLADINIQITSDDKQDCSKKTLISVYTINQYLRGNVINIKTAETLVTYFSKVIAKRADRFSQASKLINA